MITQKEIEEWLASLLPVGANLIFFEVPDVRQRHQNLSAYKEEKDHHYGVYSYNGNKHLFKVCTDTGTWELHTLVKLVECQPEKTVTTRGVNLYPASRKEIGGSKWGYIDGNGTLVLEAVYEEAYEFQSNGLAVVRMVGKSGIINEKGYFIVPPKYDSINPFFEGRATAITPKGFTVINGQGTEITSKSYSYIGDYHEGRAIFADMKAGKYLYGYLNRQGREAIPLQYESASDFKDGKAVVKLQDQSFATIGPTGKILASYPYSFVGSYGEGTLAFQKEMNGKYGYMDVEGNIIIQPQFSSSQAFRNGRAIVNESEGYQNMYGLINREGKYIIKPKYNAIQDLGENRLAIGKAIDSKYPFFGSEYAIGDNDGHILTGFLFNGVSEYENGLASAYDDQYTFFLDQNGKKVTSLPAVSGSGTLQLQGNLIQGNIDYRLYYFDRNENMVWKQNTLIPLNRQFKVQEKKFKPNKDYLVYYPQLEGMSDKESQRNVNTTLAVLSKVKKVDPSVQLDYNYFGDFEVSFYKKDLVEIKVSGYNYPFGAAHGMPTEIYTHINLQSGKFFTLKDLFKKGSSYVEKLSKIIAEQIKNDPQYSYVFPDTYKGINPNQPFYITESTLYIYFTPYEIAPYAAGFPTFEIPFEEIMSIIDTNGEFWMSFH